MHNINKRELSTPSIYVIVTCSHADQLAVLAVPTLIYISFALDSASYVLGVTLGGESDYCEDLNYASQNNRNIQTTAFNFNTQNIPPVSGSGGTMSGVAIYIPAFIGSFKMGLQIAIKYEGSEFFFRVLWTGTWYNWKKVSLV